jgi:hypothetical protein
MSNMVEDLASDDLLAALTTNMAAYWSAYGRTDKTILQATPDVVWFYTGIPVALFNGVLSVRL